ncbi:MAG: nucleotidyltransferase domain-containing protein [Planctomycetota bacterium]
MSTGTPPHPPNVLAYTAQSTPINGTATEDSDLDLLVVTESSEAHFRRAAAIRRLVWPPETAMDVLVFTPEEVEYWKGTPNHIVTEAFRTGRMVYAA